MSNHRIQNLQDINRIIDILSVVIKIKELISIFSPTLKFCCIMSTYLHKYFRKMQINIFFLCNIEGISETKTH